MKLFDSIGTVVRRAKTFLDARIYVAEGFYLR